MDLISDQERGVHTEKRSKIIEVIDELTEYGKTTVTTNSSLSGTWRMLWTTEKEQLFIIKNANIFDTKTGDVLQVIDVENGLLNNVITFSPYGVFFVRSMRASICSESELQVDLFNYFEYFIERNS